MDPLLTTPALDRSEVVANSSMNRQRRLRGSNSYTRDLGLDPIAFLNERLTATGGPVAWLDLCCGTARALIEAAACFQSAGLDERVRIVGVDLVPMFDPIPAALRNLSLESGSLPGWSPEGRFDLITCVHGLHYLGDKLALLSLASGWLRPEGRFLAHLDPDNLRFGSGKPAGRAVLATLRSCGFEFDRHRHVLRRTGPAEVCLPFQYLGADDTAGPNYTGQPAVHSYYMREETSL